MFDPEKFMVKITPIHKNEQCKAHKLETIDGYTSYCSYRNVENSLKEVGFDVLVFVPSNDEENGLVTCGNAILGGGKLNV
jgi:23S rRNA (adenine2503-C2)-methyltransferase